MTNRNGMGRGFNNFFVSKGPKLADEINEPPVEVKVKCLLTVMKMI